MLQLCPWSRSPESHEPSSAVAECGCGSSLIHSTVWPAFTVSVRGTYEKFLMYTITGVVVAVGAGDAVGETEGGGDAPCAPKRAMASAAQARCTDMRIYRLTHEPAELFSGPFLKRNLLHQASVSREGRARQGACCRQHKLCRVPDRFGASSNERVRVRSLPLGCE